MALSESSDEPQIWEEHDELFHYTDFSGLKGIMEGRCLHATNFRFLNDGSEIYRIRDVLIDRTYQAISPLIEKLFERDPDLAKQIREEAGTEDLVLDMAQKIIGGLYDVTLGTAGQFEFFNPFIVAFCGHKDQYERANGLLSQWRGYGRSTGVAIVFDAKKLCELHSEETKARVYSDALVADVVYEGDEKGTASLWKLIESDIKNVIPNFLSGRTDFKGLRQNFAIVISRYKHRSFAEEKEVRLVTAPLSRDLYDHMSKMEPEKVLDIEPEKSIVPILYRGDLSAYIEIFRTLDQRLPIKRIIVGPGPGQEQRAARVKYFVRDPAIEILSSEIPLVV